MSEPHSITETREPGGPRIAMISIHGHVATHPPIGATDTGGQVIYVLELARKFAELGYAVDIWTRALEDRPAVEIAAPGVRILRAACGPAGFVRKEDLHAHLDEWCANALALIRGRGLAYVLINSHYWDAGLAGATLARALHTPHFHTPHSLGLAKQRAMESAGTPTDAYNFATRIPAEHALYAGADRLIATTAEMADMLIADYAVPADRMSMIPPGYDDTRFYPIGEASRARLRERLGFSGTVFFSLGRLARTKGFDLLIRAFAVAAGRVPDPLLVLGIGATDEDPPAQRRLYEELQEVARACGVAHAVRFLGNIPHRETVDYYRAADVFVLSSRVEPFGMTAVEAMACGTPTVVTVHGGLFRALTLGRNALFADPLDAEHLGITMMKPVRHPRLRARLARMGAHRARSLFTWTGIAQQLVSLAENQDCAPRLAARDECEWDEPWTDTE